MAVKPIIEIDVRDEKFKAFKELFDDYSARVKELPDEWSKVGDTTESMASGFDRIVAALATQTDLLTRNRKEQEEQAQEVERTERSMARTTTHAWNFSRYMRAATLDIVKISGVIGALGGLLGTGSLFGLDRLARTAAGGLRAARGLGTTYGEREAFNLDYRRYFDPESVLGNVADARSDWSKRWVFNALGIQGVDKKGTADLATEAADRARELFRGSDRSLQFAESHGLTQLFSMDDLRRMAETSDAEWAKTRTAFQTDRDKLNVGTSVNRGWQDFLDQLSRAATQIQTTFITGLAPLAPTFERLSKATSDLVDAFLRNPDVKKWLEEAGKGLEDFAKWVGSADFKTGITEFIDGIKRMGRVLKEWFDWMFPADGPRPGGSSGAPGQSGPAPVPHNPNDPNGGVYWDWNTFTWRDSRTGLSPGTSPIRRQSYTPANDSGMPGVIKASYGGAGGSAGPSTGFFGDIRQEIYDAAVRAGLRNADIIADIGAAQSAIETGNGRHVVGNNFFGIKAGGGVGSGSVSAQTTEVIGGRSVGVNDSFAAFHSRAESAAGYVEFLLRNRRYGELLQSRTHAEALAALGRSGYATDPNYTAKVGAILGVGAGGGGRGGGSNYAAATQPQSNARTGPWVRLEIRNNTGGSAVVSASQLAV